jgi:CheY-like chemotaxis protein
MQETETTGLSETTFIMVDDSVDDIFTTRRKIRREGIINRFVSERNPTRLFQSLEDLIKLGVEKQTFLILLDLHMPGENGFHILRKIRGHPEFGDVPVVMFSGSNDEADMFEFFDLGGDAFIVKPFSPDEFYAALANIPKVKKRLLM